MDGRHQDVFIIDKSLNQKNVIKTAEMPDQAVQTAIIGMISAKACLVTFSIIRPDMDREALVNLDKLYKKWRKKCKFVKISIGACTSLAFALQSQNFIKNIQQKFIQESLLLNCMKRKNKLVVYKKFRSFICPLHKL